MESNASAAMTCPPRCGVAATGVRARLGRHGGRLAAACPEFGHFDTSSADALRGFRIRVEARLSVGDG
jgi:hypothetical protein